MRIALISDIHGNLVALEAVLAALENMDIDSIICLGDVAATGPQPRECLQRVRALGCPVVMGNTDERFAAPLMPSEEDPPDDEDWRRIQEIDAWGRAQISEEEQAFAVTFVPTVERRLSEDILFLGYHGSPRSNRELILPTTEPEALADMVGGITATVLAGGHTHAVMLRQLNHRLVLNPGSVGLPYERLPTGEVRHPPWAEWALLSVENGQLHIQFRRTPLDREAVVRAALDSGMPHAAWWAREWAM